MILEVHTKSVPLDPDVNLGRIASSTPGMVGADLANLVNEAVLLAAKRNHERVTEADFTDALEKIVLGTERQVMLSLEDRRRTAYHEGGHAIVGMLTEGADPVRKISIIPRGQSLGVTFSAPDTDRFNFSDRELRAKIKVALGGRCAEEVVFGDLTTGAESDFQQLTQIARQMVGRWGMSEKIGTITVLRQEGWPGPPDTSEETQRLIDEEVRTLVSAAHDEVMQLLGANRERLDRLAQALLEHETLDQDDAYAAAGIEPPPADMAGDLALAARAAQPAGGGDSG
jgi:cell division protease FtsH